MICVYQAIAPSKSILPVYACCASMQGNLPNGSCCLCSKALFFGLRVSIVNMSTTDVRRDQVSCDQSSRAFDLANAASA